MSNLTKFQGREALYDDWVASGKQGTPPERPIFRGYGVSAMVDPFSTFKMGVVIYPHKATEHLTEQSTADYLKVHRVALSVGQRVMAIGAVIAPTARFIQRVDGFAVPDHCHLVVGLAERGAEPFTMPSDAGEKNAELDERWKALTLPDSILQTLETDLQNIDKDYAS